MNTTRIMLDNGKLHFKLMNFVIIDT